MSGATAITAGKWNTTSSQVSFLRFAETLYDMPPLNERDGMASDMLDCFDFSQAPRTPEMLTPLACGG